jgi:hypothetical protein
MKLGMQGVSIVLASGDSGVGGPDGCLGSGQIFRYLNYNLYLPFLSAALVLTLSQPCFPSYVPIYHHSRSHISSFWCGCLDRFRGCCGPICLRRWFLKHLSHPKLPERSCHRIPYQLSSTVPILLHHRRPRYWGKRWYLQ